jgi:hypothetical protein
MTPLPKTPKPKIRQNTFLTKKHLFLYFAIGAAVGAVVYRLAQYMMASESPVLVGDGSIIWQHGSGVGFLPGDHTRLVVVRRRKATKLTISPQAGTAGSSQTIPLSPDWSLTDSATSGFQIVREDDGSGGERYVAICPGAEWTAGADFVCTPSPDTQLTPITLNVSNNGCPAGSADSNHCALGSNGKWWLSFHR